MTDLAVHDPHPMRLDTDQLKFIASTEFVPKAYRGNLPAIMACVATGRELGIGDMESLRQINVIDGKPSLSAELMVSLARRAGHSIQGDVTAERAKVTGKRADTGDTMTVEYTLPMAERAGLLGKANWKKHPESMLWARAVSQLARMLFADTLAGVSYTPDEAEMSDEERVVEATSVTVPDTPAPDDSASGETLTGSAPPPAATPDADTEQTTFVIPEKARNRETGE